MRFWDSARQNTLAGRIKRIGVGGLSLACIGLAGAVVAYATQVVNNPDTTVRFIAPDKDGARQANAEVWAGSDKSEPKANPEANPNPKSVGGQVDLAIHNTSKDDASKKETPTLAKPAATAATTQIRIKQSSIDIQGEPTPANSRPDRKSLVEAMIARARRSAARAVPDSNVVETWISDQRPTVLKPQAASVAQPRTPTVAKPQATGVAARLRAASESAESTPWPRRDSQPNQSIGSAVRASSVQASGPERSSPVEFADNGASERRSVRSNSIEPAGQWAWSRTDDDPVRQTAPNERPSESSQAESGTQSGSTARLVIPRQADEPQARPTVANPTVAESPAASTAAKPTVAEPRTAETGGKPQSGMRNFWAMPLSEVSPSMIEAAVRSAKPTSQVTMLDQESAQKPAETAAEKPAEKPVQQPAQAPVRAPARKPMKKPAAKPVQPATAATGATVDPVQATAATAEVPPSELGPFQVLGQAGELVVVLRRSKLLRTKVDIYRTAVVDPAVCDVVQFTPREVSIIGKGQGATHVTFWFEDGTHTPTTYLVRVVPDPEVQERREEQYSVLEEVLAELFPDSKVYLTPVADKLIVRGQARDAGEAAQIMAVIRGEAVAGGATSGRATDPLAQEGQQGVLASEVINMLRIPGVQQVALKVKIAELNRTAARAFGVDLNATMLFDGGTMVIQSLLNQATGATGITSGNLIGNFDSGNIQFAVHYLEQHSVLRMLSEPTLVTLSGRPASFVAGGEFPVPTTVGVAGAAAVTTDFRAFGAIITFLPVVLDKDRIRLEVAPEFSQIDSDLANEMTGALGLQTRSVTTTVEMRAGQTLAIAGLLDDSMTGENQGNIPFVAQIFGQRSMGRNETELIILVTPELVHPMEPDEVPPLPGFDVTEPTNTEFYLWGRIEGRPTHEYRSTIWPRLRHRYKAGGPAMISGPFGHGD